METLRSFRSASHNRKLYCLFKNLKHSAARTLRKAQHCWTDVGNGASRKLGSDGRYLPLDMRKKQTRAIRRALTKKEAGMKTLKQQKKDKHFPQRRYAVKA